MCIKNSKDEVKKVKNVENIINNDTIILKFYKYIEGEKTLYKTLEIKELDKKYDVLILPNNIKKIMNFKQFRDIIISLEKECNQKEKTQAEIEEIKKKYPKGTRIELIKMNDYLDPVPDGTKGVVRYVNDYGDIEMKWEIKRSLPIIVGLDEFKVI